MTDPNTDEALVADCARQFRDYERQHRAKGTPEADAKAEVNRLFAERCERALSQPPSGGWDDAAVERANRQATVHDWCARVFGQEHATNVGQRAVRFLEEAVEAYQSAEGDRAMAHRLINYVFDRTPGELGQELGGVGVTILALAAAAGLDAEAEEAREVSRVLAKPAKHFYERNQVKNAAGFDVTGGYPTERAALNAAAPREEAHEALTRIFSAADEIISGAGSPRECAVEIQWMALRGLGKEPARDWSHEPYPGLAEK